MTTDEQEAESRKYSDVAMVLRLSSGNFAIFGPNRKLYCICVPYRVIEILHEPYFKEWITGQVQERHSPAIRAEDVLDVGEIEI